MGISQSLPAAPVETDIEAIGGDFRVIGNDFRMVMSRHPATAEAARAIGETPRQLEMQLAEAR